MTKDELWLVYVAKNPSFEGTEPFRISPAGLRKMFDQTWAQATKTEADKKSLFDDLFGGRRP